MDPRKIMVLHHEIDGRESDQLFDWPFVPAYSKALAVALGLKHYFSWRVGGLRREMAPSM